MKRGIFILFSIFSISLFACNNNQNSSLGISDELSNNLSLISSSFTSEIESISLENNDQLINSLNKIKDSYRIEGKYEVNGYTHTFINISTSDSYYFSEFYYNNLYPEVVVPYVEGSLIFENNKVYSLETSLDNKVKKVEQDVLWSMFENPFLSIETEDFIKLDNQNTYSLNNEKALILGNALTGWSHEGVVSNEFEIVNDEITLIKMSLSTLYDGDINYVMNVSKSGCATKKNMVYETKDYHNDLKRAFDNFNSLNYTIEVQDKAYSINDKENDVYYNYYRVEGMNYNSYENEGLVLKDDGLYKFEVENNKAILKDKTENETLNYTTKFTFAPELFTKIDENTYSLEAKFLVGEILSILGATYDISLLGGYYGMDLLIYVENDTFKGYSFNYNVQDLYSNMHLDYLNIGNTSMPFDVSFDSSSEEGGGNEFVIPASYIGVYEGDLSVGLYNDETHIIVEITNSYIKINDKEVVIDSFSIYEGFIIFIDGVEYYLMDASYEDPVSKVMFMNTDYSMYGFMFRVK